jgi:hypothetical protein
MTAETDIGAVQTFPKHLEAYFARCTIVYCSTEWLNILPAGGHEFKIIGYKTLNKIVSGEPIASERFGIGGHDWVSSILFNSDSNRLTFLYPETSARM